MLVYAINTHTLPTSPSAFVVVCNCMRVFTTSSGCIMQTSTKPAEPPAITCNAARFSAVISFGVSACWCCRRARSTAGVGGVAALATACCVGVSDIFLCAKFQNLFCQTYLLYSTQIFVYFRNIAAIWNFRLSNFALLQLCYEPLAHFAAIVLRFSLLICQFSGSSAYTCGRVELTRPTVGERWLFGSQCWLRMCECVRAVKPNETSFAERVQRKCTRRIPIWHKRSRRIFANVLGERREIG